MGWKEYTARELEILIKQNPLNEGAVNQTFEELINEVEFRLGAHPDYSLVCPVFKDGKVLGKFNIVIYTNGPSEEVDISEVHELIHVYYRVGGWLYNSAGVFHDMIKNETERIIRENPALVDHIRKCYLEKNRQTCGKR